MTGMYRIERWPTDVILTPQSNLIATFGCPNKPEPYLTQLNNLAGHFRGTTGRPTGKWLLRRAIAATGAAASRRLPTAQHDADRCSRNLSQATFSSVTPGAAVSSAVPRHSSQRILTLLVRPVAYCRIGDEHAWRPLTTAAATPVVAACSMRRLTSPVDAAQRHAAELSQ